MHLHLSTSVSLVALAVASMLPSCTIKEQSACEGESCSEGGSGLGGGLATGGSTSAAGANSSGGVTAVGSSANAGTAGSSKVSGGASSIATSAGGTTTGASTGSGGAISTGGASARTGGSTSTGGSSARTGGATSTGGSSARAGGATSAGGTSTRAGGATSAGASATGGKPSTGGTTGGTDLCPTDPNKVAPGTCGCGVADTDTDGDGVVDCNDICPNNPQISKAGKTTISVVFTAAAQSYPQYLDGLRSNMIAAGNEWAKQFRVPHDVSLEVQIDISADVATANGKSADSVYVEALGSMSIYQQSATYEILTGTDPNGADPDIEITFGLDPLSGASGHHYWFDPDPVARTATVPNDGVDTVSTCLHELGHALGFNGWRDWATGELPSPGNYCSYYDYMSSTDGSDFFFDGTRAVAAYKSHVPETYGNITHIGNLSPHPGQDLDLDLMRGTRTLLGHRYYISDVDLAILADVGLPLSGTSAASNLCKTTPNQPRVVQLGPRPVTVD